MSPLVSDDAAPAQQKSTQQPEPQSRDAAAQDTTLAAQVAASPAVEDARQTLSAADPPKHMQ